MNPRLSAPPTFPWKLSLSTVRLRALLSKAWLSAPHRAPAAPHAAEGAGVVLYAGATSRTALERNRAGAWLVSSSGFWCALPRGVSSVAATFLVGDRVCGVRDVHGLRGLTRVECALPAGHAPTRVEIVVRGANDDAPALHVLMLEVSPAA